MDLCGVEAGEFILEPIDFLYCGIRKHTCCTLVGTFIRHQGIEPTPAVIRYPLFQGFVAKYMDAAIRKCERILSNAFVVSRIGRLSYKALYHRGDKGKLVLCYLSCF